MLTLLGFVTLLLGTMLYNRYFKESEFRDSMKWAIYISLIGGVTSLIFVLRLNLVIGISDIVFILFTDIVT